MEEVLDNPVWNALISGNKNLSIGNNHIKYFDTEVSPFVAFDEISTENFNLLHDRISYTAPVLFVSPGDIEIPKPWNVRHVIKGLQMICNNGMDPCEAQSSLTTLTEEHVPQMVALTKLTNPGPFGNRTINFGHYRGIFEGEKLAAMAGQRLHIFNYAEISAVCTHPGHTGKGYARQLLIHQINRIRSAGEIPFLHVRHDNERAIKVYESLGFSTRTYMYFYVMQKKQVTS